MVRSIRPVSGELLNTPKVCDVLTANLVDNRVRHALALGGVTVVLAFTAALTLLPRDAIHSVDSAVTRCPSVCLSVCPSVRHTPVFYRNN